MFGKQRGSFRGHYDSLDVYDTGIECEDVTVSFPSEIMEAGKRTKLAKFSSAADDNQKDYDGVSDWIQYEGSSRARKVRRRRGN